MSRRHALFIGTKIGDAVCGQELPLADNEAVETKAGKMSWLTGAFGGMNFGVPARLKPEANIVRHWGQQAQNTQTTYKKLFEAFDNLPEVGDGQSSNYTMLGLRPRKAQEKTMTVNGVIGMAYTDSELDAAKTYYAHHGNAALAKLPKALFETLSWQRLPDSLEWVHVVLSSDAAFEEPSFDAPILHGYIHRLVRSFMAYGDDFAQEFVRTCRGWSGYWLADQMGDEDLTLAVDEADTFAETQRIDKLLEENAPSFNLRRSIAFYPILRVQPPEPVMASEAPEVYTDPIAQKSTNYFCFGMGSLINTPSRVGTAGPAAQCAIPVAVGKGFEFCPCWNYQNRAGGSQLTAGGMVMRNDPRNKNPDAETAGVIYPCMLSEEAMKAQDEREAGYTRFNIPNETIRSLGWQQIPEGITVFMYVPNTELPDDHPKRVMLASGKPAPRASFPTREYPLPQTYIDVCLLGCLEHGPEFAAKWVHGFVGWPSPENPYWLNDRPSARAPWSKTPRFAEVDEILRAEIPDSLSVRKLPVVYATMYAGGPSGCGSNAGKTKALQPDVSYTGFGEATRDEVCAATRSPEHFIFEYDDRISSAQWQRVASSGEGMPCRLSKDAGYQRSFCLRREEEGGFTLPALVVSADSASTVNGVAYPAPSWWLKDGSAPPQTEDKFCGQGMQRVELDPAHVTALHSWMAIPKGAKVYSYAATDPKPADYEHPLRQSLLDMIIKGCLEHSLDEDFAAEWLDTTAGWLTPDGKCYWLNDRHVARRPWVAIGGNYKIFDRLVHEAKSKNLPSGLLLSRRLMEEYVLNYDFIVPK